MSLLENDIYLDVLERNDCIILWNDFEYDFDNPCEELNIGLSVEKADEWFADIQKQQGMANVRLGIFLHDGTVIGDVAIQDIDRKNSKCSVGMGIRKISNRKKGYGQQGGKANAELSDLTIYLLCLAENNLTH